MSHSLGRMSWDPKQGWLGDKPLKPTYRYHLKDDKIEEIRETLVHTFTMGDVEDPDLYAAEPLWQWQQSEAGQWVMTHAVESPTWYRAADPFNYGYSFKITAKLRGKDYTFWQLKWGSRD